jgi:hypothetical protein
VNQVRVREASIDVHVDAETDTFALFTAGQLPCRGTVDVRLATPGGVLERQVPVDLPRFGNQELSLRALFGDAAPRKGGILTLQQPAQPLFYGRMLAGRRCTRDGALAANHSFYDCSGAPEYWDDGRPSARTYPLFPGLATRIRQYPIFSPCVLHSAVDFHDAHGRLLHSFPCEPVRSPSQEVLEFPVTEAQQAAGLASATAFRFRAWAENGGTPRRINHQIVYEDGAGRSTLAASVAISLRHPAMFTAPGKEGLTWGQCPVSADLDTRVGLVFDRADGAAETVELRLIGEEGEVFREARTLAAGSAWVLDPAQIVPELARGAGARPHSLWYWATSRRSDLSAYSVLRHRATGHCSGDHSF